MPIFLNEGNNTQLEFGYGDIEVAAGLVDGEHGCVCFFDIDKPQPIGEKGRYIAGEEVPAEETPVRMVFLKEASIDVVIRALMEAKRLMVHKNTLADSED